MSIFKSVFPSKNAAQAALNAWEKNGGREVVAAQVKAEIAVQKAAVLEERAGSSTVYDGWGSWVDSLEQELYWVENTQYAPMEGAHGWKLEAL